MRKFENCWKAVLSEELQLCFMMRVCSIFWGCKAWLSKHPAREDDTEEMQQRSEFYIAHVSLGKPQVNHQVPCRSLYKSRMPGSPQCKKSLVNPCHSQLLLALRKCWRELELYKAPSVAMKSALELFFVWFVYTWFLLADFFSELNLMTVFIGQVTYLVYKRVNFWTF